MSDETKLLLFIRNILKCVEGQDRSIAINSIANALVLISEFHNISEEEFDMILDKMDDDFTSAKEKNKNV